MMRLLGIIVLFVLVQTAEAQDEILLRNPSFEDIAIHSLPPSHWTDCSFPNQTPVDVQPSGAWGVTRAAIDGNTYLGMTVRDNRTYEGVVQKLQTPLVTDVSYEVSVSLCRSAVYESQVMPPSGSELSSLEIRNLPLQNFDSPVRLQVLGCWDFCQQCEILLSSPPVDHLYWRRYTFTFKAPKDFSHIKLQAYYNNDDQEPYNGNILVDDFSSFRALTAFAEDGLEIDSIDQEIPLPVGKRKISEETHGHAWRTGYALSLILSDPRMSDILARDQINTKSICAAETRWGYLPQSAFDWNFVKETDTDAGCLQVNTFENIGDSELEVNFYLNGLIILDLLGNRQGNLTPHIVQWHCSGIE